MITIRENDDIDGVDNFSQMKLVTESTPGILVENNIVHFSDYVENDDERQSYAIAAADFVDKDDLFPYCPHERIRRDATTVILVTSYPSDKAPTSDLDVVVTRWTFSRICNSNLNIPAEYLRQMRDRSGLASEIILNCARETLHLK